MRDVVREQEDGGVLSRSRHAAFLKQRRRCLLSVLANAMVPHDLDRQAPRREQAPGTPGGTSALPCPSARIRLVPSGQKHCQEAPRTEPAIPSPARAASQRGRGRHTHRGPGGGAAVAIRVTLLRGVASGR